MRRRVLLPILGLALSLLTLSETTPCGIGQIKLKGSKTCTDVDECTDTVPYCGSNATCFNTDGSYYCQCHSGYGTKSGNVNFTIISSKESCGEINECLKNKKLCGPNATCKNTMGSYYCTCQTGYHSSNGKEVFLADDGVTCEDKNECLTDSSICGVGGDCENREGSYQCACRSGYSNYGNGLAKCIDKNECLTDSSICGVGGDCENREGSYQCACRSGYSNYGNGLAKCIDKNECLTDSSICGVGGDCENREGSYQCACRSGYSNYGNDLAKCIWLACNRFTPAVSPEQMPVGLEEVLSLMNGSCTSLSRQEGGKLNGEKLLETLLSIIDKLLSGGTLNSNKKVTTLLGIVEDALRLIGPLLSKPHTRRPSKLTEVEFFVARGQLPPQGPISLSSEHAHLDIHWETAAGDATYPGFAVASLLTYKSLESSTNNASRRLSVGSEGTTFLVNSKVVTASVSNTDTRSLEKPITLTFAHLQFLPQSDPANHTCAYWNTSSGDGEWDEQGCRVVESNDTHTVCSCTHLSSFAVLMALYEFQDTFQLQVITWVGLGVSQVCLLLCIVTFSLCRSIQCTRNTIHLNLCICLFIANLVFLAGISSTQNKGGCAFVAGLLHFFFLAAFCWMCLEGVQLYRMVVRVFNTTLRPLHMMGAGYGVPAIIVVISASVYAQGYGTDRHCWLTLKRGFIWSFFGPVCVIIMVNAFFFMITVWKLAEKFSSLNPDLTNLRKIRVFTVTAVAQLCVLGTMWIFGCFLLDQSTLPLAYLFTFLNSLQGALLFLMHCLLSKQVREEYAKFLSRIYTPQKKYSEFNTNQSSNSQGSKSAQNTKESRT
ncbi:hypothetical protein AAFF_G00270180 [Aldrovandia affinis]|uniref:CD97 antigen-like n=1 Tax=Aldrovandia affinis TaxID=143900 RepID=A0AAD7RBP7_9TELE|nr:hypothetical protein AAFF_G00270180 [Aldrovandia affinis]